MIGSVMSSLRSFEVSHGSDETIRPFGADCVQSRQSFSSRVSAELVDGVNHVRPPDDVGGGPYIGLLIALFRLSSKKKAAKRQKLGVRGSAHRTAGRSNNTEANLS